MASNGNNVQFEFSQEEIRSELSRHGIRDVDQSSLHQFQEELQNLVRKMTSSSLQTVDTSTASSPPSSDTSATCLDSSDKRMLARDLPLPSSLSTKTVTDARPGLTVASQPCESVNPVLPPNVTVSSQQPSKTTETSDLAGRYSSTVGQPLVNVADIGHKKQENICPLNTGGVPLSQQTNNNNNYNNNRLDNYEIKENAWTRPIAARLPPSFSSSSLPLQLPLPPSLPLTQPKPSHVAPHVTGDSDENYLSDAGINPDSHTNSFVTKRKISRRGPDGKRYIDESESVYSSSSSCSNSCTGSLVDLTDYQNRLKEITNRDDYFYPRSSSCCDDRPKSTIIVTPTPPRLKKKEKTDPVNRYHEFQNYWSLHKVPGENNHNALRWSIREKIARHDVIQSRPQKSFVANSYVVPTQKPRRSLRWQIRTDLAHGIMPSSTSYDY
ncbi:hydrolethalus syndrome protein 1 homolog [Argonauta hians]